MGKTNLYFNCKTFKDTRAIFKAFKLSCNSSLLWFQTSVLTTNFASDHTEVPSFAFILHFTIVLCKILGFLVSLYLLSSLFAFLRFYRRGAVTSWLLRSTPGRVAWVRALAGVIVLCSKARHFALTLLLFTQVYK